MVHESERKAFEQGAEAMRRVCVAEFTRRAKALRVQERTLPEAHSTVMPSIVVRLRLSADISEQEHAAYLISKIPAPAFRAAEGETP